MREADVVRDPGSAIGVGVTMALPFDLRLAAEGAKLGLTFAKLGILPGLAARTCCRGWSGARARGAEPVVSARVIEADEAARIGLVNRVVPPPRRWRAPCASWPRRWPATTRRCSPTPSACSISARPPTLAETLENDPKVDASPAAAKKKGS